ncbi:hypothetical protein N7466_005696 [Penicillium verhagenii]|uniref:uncharacterized protein n=1 Tax=Penicillium verhagenii TaxID=1562060 RepID=UPI0025451F4F|nr:uncharacterized protein N7466_005696 [Penicillium verhagenii]KAJ5930203.1 hypothetical protein N7466_005696 [Penicillium verhagenii]
MDTPERDEDLRQEILSGSLQSEFALLSKQFDAGWREVRKRALENPRAAAIAQHWLVRFQIPSMPTSDLLLRSCITNPRHFVWVRRNTTHR